MFKIYDYFEVEFKLVLLFYIIDFKCDIVVKLVYYVDNLGVRSDCWYFVMG